MDLPFHMTDHKLHRHQPVYLPDHQKHGKTQAVAGKFVLQAHEGIAKIPLEKAEYQAKANGADQSGGSIKTQGATRLPAATQADKQVNCQVLKKKYNDCNDKEI